MGLIHQAFRSELAHAPDLIRGVEAGDTKRSNLVSDHLGNIISVLHHHHAAEDALLWPILQARVPACDNEIRRVEAEHAHIAESVDKVQALRASWAASADSRAAEQLVAALEELSARVDEHLEDEEQNIVPLINSHITAAEWQELLDRGAAFLTPKNVRFALAFAGFVLQDASADERRRFLADVPLPPRLLYRLFGERAFSAYRTRIYGSPAATT
jgi:hypothetical protein